jgi:putative endonuclease
MDPVKCTEEHLRVSKNISCEEGSNSSAKKSCWAHQRGLKAEEIVIDYYQSRNFLILKQRMKTPFAEVDLLFRAPQGHLLMVEVKSVNLTSFYLTRVSKKQKNRLEKAVLFLANRFSSLVEIHWAFVGRDDRVTIFEDITS